jgi:GTPase SAR1 family protein
MAIRIMKRGNKTGVLAFCAVLLSILLAGVGSAQAQIPPDVAPPAATSPVITPTTTPSPSFVSPEATGTTVSPIGTPSSNQLPSPSATDTTASPKVTPSASAAPAWNFWQSTAGNWIMFAGGIMVALVGVIAQRSLERYKQWLDKRRKHEEREVEEAKHAQALEDGIKAYRERLKEELCHLSISDLPNVPSSLNLESFYLPLQVREKDPLYYPKEEEMAAAWELMEVLQPSHAHLAKPASQAHLAKPAEIVLSPEDALARFLRIAVLGDPGVGKTTMLSYLAFKMAQEAEPKLPYLPVHVKLGRFEDRGKDLWDSIADELDKRYGFPARSYLEQQLDEGKAALLLDGLDEVAVEANPEEVKNPYKNLTDQIDQLATRFHKAPIVVTYRRAWRGVSNRFQPLELLNFSWGQIQEFVKKWFESDPNKAEKLLKDLAGNLRMQTLAENPLILSLIAIVYGQDLKLPQRRAELYRRCAELLLQEWDDRRGVERFSQFNREDIQNLLIEAAWHFHCERKPYFHKNDLLELISGFLASSNISIPLEKNKVLLNEITGSSSLLKEAAHELYGFLHLTFQEYFAALAVKQATEQGDRTRLQEVIKQKHRHDPWWEEVVLLLAECMDDATPLLMGILGYPLGQLLPGDINQLVPEGEQLAVNDDLFDSDLLLAARCLVGKPTLQMQGLRDRIIAEVKNLLQTSPYKLDWERTTTVLVEINDKALIDELLAMLADNGINEEKRRSIASAFGKLADQSVAQRLLELLKSNPELDLFVRLSIIDALGALKATFAVSSLQEMLTTENSANAKEQIIRTLGVIGNKEVASSLLDSLLDTTTDPNTKLTIAQALRNLKDESLTHRILEKLQDETIEWQVRWLLTESLEGLQESAKDSLMEMLESQAIDEPVRVGIAATLGTWRMRESIPYLRNAIENKVVPHSWQQRYHTISGYIWGTDNSRSQQLG